MPGPRRSLCTDLALLTASGVGVVGAGVHLPGQQAVRLEVGQMFDHMQQKGCDPLLRGLAPKHYQMIRNT